MASTSTTGSYRFALRPKWILSHVLIVMLLIATFSAGFWQLRRLDDRREQNQLVEARSSQPTKSLEQVTSASVPLETLAYVPVSAVGTFESEHEYLVANRTFGGTPGFWVFTPLRLHDGSAVMVNRGFIARATVQQELSDYEAPSGEVEVEGIILESVDGAVFGSVADWREISRPDAGLMQTLVDLLRPDYYVQLTTAAQESPVPLDPPNRGEGPHFSYAMQWFIFTIIGLIGYPLVLRRIAGGGKKRVGVAPPLEDEQ